MESTSYIGTSHIDNGFKWKSYFSHITSIATNLFKFRYKQHFTVSGRIPWNSLFKGVFGKDFETIITGHPQTLATAIGSAARLLRGIVNAEDEVPKTLISCWQTYVHGSYGQGFLRNILEWFPELESLKHGMEAAASKPFLDAKIRYEQQIEVLRLSCQGEYTALAEEGICIYRSILNGISDDIEISGKIHILPGTIEYHGRLYTRVADYTGYIGRVKCRKSGCKHIYDVPMGDNPQFDVLGRSMQIIEGGKIARCATATLADRLNYRCIIQEDKCIQCCIRTGVSGMQGYELTMDENDELTQNAPVLIVSRIN